MPLILDPGGSLTFDGATFDDLLAEFYARGFQHLNDGGTGVARAKRWINQAYADVCERQSWPFVTSSITGTAPLTITDLRAVLSVTDTTTVQALERIDRRTLVEMYPNGLTDLGTPAYYYREGLTTIRVYPVQAVTLKVQYLAIPPELVAGADATVVPSRFTDVIVDGAVVRGKKGRDDYDQMKAEFEEGIAKMTASYNLDDLNQPDVQVLYNSENC